MTIWVERSIFMPFPKNLRKKEKPKAGPSEIQNIPLSKKRKFQKRLLSWYEECGHNLPWRRTADPGVGTMSFGHRSSLIEADTNGFHAVHHT